MAQSSKDADLQRDTVEIDDKQHMTTDFGIKISDPDHWLRVVDDKNNGPSLLEDPIAREKIMRFDHERIPERVVHARGVGAFGTFRLHRGISHLTTAGVLTDTSRETPLFVRFSTVQGSKGSADTVRDVRGFAVKMYTDEGNWDIVGNNIPVFFIQDAMKFPDVIHAVKPEPHNEIPQGQSAHNNFWDFMYMHSETTHMQQWVMSDRAIPRSLRMMQGFGVNTYSLINAEGKRHFVKFYFLPELGVHSLVWDEALKICGQDPDFHRKDLMDAIDAGHFPKWKFGIQAIPEEKQHDFEFDILDATKIWPEELVPIEYIGEMELNRNIDEFFTQTEQVAFCTSHIVPGVDFSDDPLLQGRNFSYFDTQISRLGPNWEELPINRPVCPYASLVNRDGAMRHRITKGKVNYWPNRYGANPPASAAQGGFTSYPEKQQGTKGRHFSAKFKEHYNQAQLFYNSLSPIEKMHVAKAFSFELDHCDEEIVYKRLAERLAVVDLELAQTVAKNVGGDTPEKAPKENKGQKTKGLSQLEYLSDSAVITTRRIAILIADGFDYASYKAMKETLQKQKAFVFTIGPQRQGVTAETGEKVIPEHHFAGMRSTLFDAVFIPGGQKHIAALSKNGVAKYWITESFAHLKAIAGLNEAVEFIRKQINLDSVKYAASSGGVVQSYGVITTNGPANEHLKVSANASKDSKGFAEQFIWHISRHRNWQRELDGLVDEVAA
ncbi:spore-specific catalase CatA [Aspergillus clavatus NRRL 1]|uniref:Catalase n=1 Tax=Aspergillus clavatus (strain ATCC 1007 / CBS 513.65 / DSM 816 / NCTC 3887 / NRRL 1 / QM 1276 / 107) TaxID=344612 RepID=A1C954_ASPCL|nr:spore-specific catalase CatA [Aspergillus clavatus NRRL 1]EAW13378.1 spore-specific catalase CatA [Aspergillus clavatus NRRL 1]